MADRSRIEWTDATWNPVRGCTKVSPGCANCYAETFAERFRGVPGHPYEQGFDLRLVPENLHGPLTWQRPRLVFVKSMSDLFHKDVPDDYVLAVAALMRRANWHTYQVLTKRSVRLAQMLAGPLRAVAAEPHIWWGVSVENRKHGLPRIEDLRRTPAAIRFLSVEPLLEDLGCVDLSGIHWMIVGGESGPGARPLDLLCELDLANAAALEQRLADDVRDGCLVATVTTRSIGSRPQSHPMDSIWRSSIHSELLRSVSRRSPNWRASSGWTCS